MAIDTAEKRRNVGGLPIILLAPGVTPNSSKDAEWRVQTGWGYSARVAAPTGALGGEYTVVYGRHRKRRR